MTSLEIFFGVLGIHFVWGFFHHFLRPTWQEVKPLTDEYGLRRVVAAWWKTRKS